MNEEFKHQESDRQKMGEIYCRTMEKYEGQVDVTFLDPRNVFAFAAYFFKHVRKSNISITEALKYICCHMKLNAIFVDGEYIKNFNDYDKLINKKINSRE
ncbi:hypothetical protein [Thalassobacillus pellis]|uniref:hypothetical protein n=1 Tax=Thalassobacillus pellis TaxID=748008 RepID=UPI001960BD01|nr:hypothetical protein [Thalassobacillus pellis]MBM7552565.1 hypothetical protein [Thalassobacillus pellis]